MGDAWCLTAARYSRISLCTSSVIIFSLTHRSAERVGHYWDLDNTPFLLLCRVSIDPCDLASH